MTRLSRRTLLTGAMAGVAVPGRALAQTPTATREVLHVGFGAFPIRWDPLGSRDFASLWLATLLYDTVLQVNPGGELAPGLAIFTGWNRDRSELTIAPRQGITFPDGTAFAPPHLVEALERARSASWRLEHVREIVAADDGSVRLRMQRIDTALESSLAHPELSVIPGGGDAFATGTIPPGTGPFAVARLGDGELMLERNRRYWQIGRPRLDGAWLSVIPEATSRSTALLTGTVDLLPDVPLLDAALMRDNPAVRLVGAESTIGCMLVPNLRQEPTNSTAFRLLLQRGIDRAALVTAATANEATGQHVPVPSSHWAFLEEPLETPDRETLRTQFRDLGYPLGLRLRLIADQANVAFSNAAVFLQDQLAYIGIALGVDLLDAADLATALAAGDYDLHATTIDAWHDPHELFRQLVRSDGVRNVNGYANATVDRLIDAATLVEDPERRAPLYRRVQEVLLREVPFVVLYLQRYFDGMTSVLTDYPQYPPVSGLAMRHCLPDPARTSR